MKKRPHQNRRGAMAVLLAVMLIVLFAFLAFAVDLGNVYVTRSQLQNAADAAALAGAQQLAEGESATTARQVAVDFAKLNEPDNGNVLVTGDVTIGVWHNETRGFSATLSNPNAVQVVVRRDGTNTAAVATSFARLFGIDSTKVTATSIATFKITGSTIDYDFVE